MSHNPVVAERPTPAWLRMVAAAAFLSVAYLALASSGEAVAAVTDPVTVAGAVAAIAASVGLAVTAVRLTCDLAGVEQPLRGLVTGSRRSIRRSVPAVIAVIVAEVMVAPGLERLAFHLGLRGSTAIVGPPPGFAVGLVLSCYAVVEAPWLEEVSIRGFLFSGLQRRFGFWPAALVSAFLWAALHRDAEVLVAFTVVGVSLAWLRQRTGSVRGGIVLHGLWNTVVSVQAFGWRPVAPAVALLLASLVLVRGDWTVAPLPALRAALAWPRRAVASVCRRIPAGPPLGGRATVLAGLILLAGYGAQTAALYARPGLSAERLVTLIGVPAMLLLAGVAMATRRTWQPPGTLAPAAAGAALVDAGVRCVTGLGGSEQLSALTAPAALLIAWWLWGVSRSAGRLAVRRSAGLASLAYMGSLIEPIPTGLWGVAWHCSMLLLAAASIARLGLVTLHPGRSAVRPARHRLADAGGRRLGLAFALAAVAISAAIFSIPQPGATAAGAQAAVRPVRVWAPSRLPSRAGPAADQPGGSSVRRMSITSNRPSRERPFST